METEILNGYWKVGKWDDNGSCVLTNIYNSKEIKVSYRQLQNIREGKDTVGRIITRRIGSNGYGKHIRNSVVKDYHWNNKVHAMGVIRK